LKNNHRFELKGKIKNYYVGTRGAWAACLSAGQTKCTRGAWGACLSAGQTNRTRGAWATCLCAGLSKRTRCALACSGRCPLLLFLL